MAETGNTEVLSTAEVADRLGITVWKAGRWIQSGRLQGGHTMGRWWATRESVDRVKAELDAERAEAV